MSEEMRRYMAGEITSAEYLRLSRERVAEEVRREWEQWTKDAGRPAGSEGE